MPEKITVAGENTYEISRWTGVHRLTRESNTSPKQCRERVENVDGRVQPPGQSLVGTS